MSAGNSAAQPSRGPVSMSITVSSFLSSAEKRAVMTIISEVRASEVFWFLLSGVPPRSGFAICARKIDCRSASMFLPAPELSSVHSGRRCRARNHAIGCRFESVVVTDLADAFTRHADRAADIFEPRAKRARLENGCIALAAAGDLLEHQVDLLLPAASLGLQRGNARLRFCRGHHFLDLERGLIRRGAMREHRRSVLAQRPPTARRTPLFEQVLHVMEDSLPHRAPAASEFGRRDRD